MVAPVEVPLFNQTHKSPAIFLYSGLFFLLCASVLFLLLGYCLFYLAQQGPMISVRETFDAKLPTSTVMTEKDKYNFFGAIISFLMMPLLMCISAVICALVGMRLLRSAGAVSQQVIPPQDYSLLAPAIKEGNEKAITEYIRLSSLSGMTGTFTKIGLTGLPLATIVLTVVLAFLSLVFPKFYDLAQLTLGAFIGSFVQKSNELTQENNHPQNKQIDTP
ncbi:hypothetical protein PGR09_04055 [Klebsiella sp. 141251]|uniref:hypothetical protein n=1 Tax=Klebsiella sp. 141251 TaxID=3020030 RepID=UPI003D358F6A